MMKTEIKTKEEAVNTSLEDFSHETPELDSAEYEILVEKNEYAMQERPSETSSSSLVEKEGFYYSIVEIPDDGQLIDHHRPIIVDEDEDSIQSEKCTGDQGCDSISLYKLAGDIAKTRLKCSLNRKKNKAKPAIPLLHMWKFIDNETFQRFLEARANKETVTTKKLQLWATNAAVPFLSEEFHFDASKTWARKFKKNHGIVTLE